MTGRKGDWAQMDGGENIWGGGMKKGVMAEGGKGGKA